MSQAHQHVRIGILGRHRQMLAQAIAVAEQIGLTALGTANDDDALAWITEGTVDALIVGGGVETISRERMFAHGHERGVRVILVSGPSQLASVLHGLL